MGSIGSPQKSSTTQDATNQQAALDAGSSSGINVVTGANGSTSLPINYTSDSRDFSNRSQVTGGAGAGSVTTGAGGTTIIHSADPDVSLAGLDLAKYIGGAAITGGQNIALAGLQFAQNQTQLNYDALNTNTALAFDTIDKLAMAQASGAQAALAQAQKEAGAGQSPPTIIYAGATPLPSGDATYTQGTGTNSSALIAVALAAAAGFFLLK